MDSEDLMGLGIVLIIALVGASVGFLAGYAVGKVDDQRFTIAVCKGN